MKLIHSDTGFTRRRSRARVQFRPALPRTILQQLIRTQAVVPLTVFQPFPILTLTLNRSRVIPSLLSICQTVLCTQGRKFPNLYSI
jgi:hypothetical protein